MVDHNRLRSLADVLGVEAWHKAFSAKVEKADLHVDVVFLDDARLGGPDDEVRFKLSLKKAEVVIVIPQTEPAKVDTGSVARSAPRKTVSHEQTITSSRKSRLSAGANGKAGIPGLGAGLGLGASGEAAASRDHAMVIKRQLEGMVLIHSLTEDRQHRWTITPSDGSELYGRPWDATSEPRLQVIDTRADRDAGLEPIVRVEVRCLREDLVISDIRLNNKTAWDAIKGAALQRNRTVAAEALIRTLLFEANLLHGDISDPLARMTLASVVAETL